MNKTFPDATAINITISTGTDVKTGKRDLVQIFHPTPESRVDQITTIDSTNPEDFERMAMIITQLEKD